MLHLKAYANASKPIEADPLEDDEHVKARCTAMVEAGTVTALVQLNKTPSSSTAQLSDQILLSLSRNSKDRGKIAQQGAVKLLITHALRNSRLTESPLSPKQGTSRSTLDAAHALARILISLNPALIFPSSTSPHITDAVAALVPLLRQTSEDVATLSNSAPRNLLPVFESLLALTNLASSPDQSAANSIIRSCFDEIEDLLLSSNEMLRRAATELVCNLVAYPSGVGKFADGSRRAKERLKILVAMADVDDMQTRMAAGGGLAMLTDYEPVISALLAADDKGKRSIEIALELVSDEDPGLRHRGFAILLNLVSAESELATKASRVTKDIGGAERIKTVLRKTRDTTVLQLGVEILKRLQED